MLYIGGILLIEFYPNVFFGLIFFFSFLISTGLLIRLLFKKQPWQIKLIPALLLSIPVLDLTFNINQLIRDRIKGEIVFSVIDDSFVSTEYVEVRKKNGALNAKYEFSAAGFGDAEKANAIQEGDSVLEISLKERALVQRITIDKVNNRIKKNGNPSSYRIMDNKLF